MFVLYGVPLRHCDIATYARSHRYGVFVYMLRVFFVFIHSFGELLLIYGWSVIVVAQAEESRSLCLRECGAIVAGQDFC